MANYVLVENRSIVHLGPIPWRHRFIQSELDDLEVMFTVSPNEMGYVRINDNFEIFPVGEAVGPAIDSRWDDPVGPTWSYVEEEIELPRPEFMPEDMPTPTTWKREAIPTFDKVSKPLDQIRQMIKDDVAGKRYVKEAAGTQVTIREGVVVTADTSRDGRAIFTQVYGTLPDGATVDWKFPEGWYTVTKEELGIVIAGGFTYIQTQFVWEKSFVDRADAAVSVDELKVIYDELNPVITPTIPGV